MRRFTIGISLYLAVCLTAIAAIVIRGDGPHPRIVSLYPHNGDLFYPGGPAQITFSQPMDEASVERAVQVSPGTQGHGVWFGTTLNLQPIGDWKPEVTYHVALVGKVTDEEGRPLHTPVSFWFRVHHIQRLGFCSVSRVRNVCETTPGREHPLTHAPRPVLQYALSTDGTLLAYTQRDASGVSHLYVLDVGTGESNQLTDSPRYADSAPYWNPGDDSSVTYYRRQVLQPGARPRLGKDEIWNIGTDGTNNLRLR